VLPVEARIDGFAIPRTSFSVYTFPDPGDPVVVAIATITAEVLLTDPAEQAPYEDLFDRLRKQALPQPESLDPITEAADGLRDE
jgi:hypothetical protein